MEEFIEELRSLLRKYSGKIDILAKDDEALSMFIIESLNSLEKYETILNDSSRDYDKND